MFAPTSSKAQTQTVRTPAGRSARSGASQPAPPIGNQALLRRHHARTATFRPAPPGPLIHADTTGPTLRRQPQTDDDDKHGTPAKTPDLSGALSRDWHQPRLVTSDDLRNLGIDPGGLHPDDKTLSTPTVGNEAVLVDDQDGHREYQAMPGQIRASAAFVDNNIVSVGADLSEFWTASVGALVFQYLDGHKLRVPVSELSYAPSARVDRYVKRGGVIYPVRDNGSVAYDGQNTPRLLDFAALKAGQQNQVRSERRQQAMMVFQFQMSLASLAAASVGMPEGNIPARPLPKIIEVENPAIPTIVMGDVKSMNSYAAGLRHISEMEGRGIYNTAGNVGMAMYDPATGDVFLQVFGERTPGMPKRIIWEGQIGSVEIPKGMTPTQIGNWIEEPVREMVGEATGQIFPNKAPNAPGPDLHIPPPKR